MAKKKVAPKGTRKPARSKKATKKTAPRGAKPTTSAPPSLSDLEESWDKSREKAPQRGGGRGANPEVIDGDYILQVQTAKVGQYRRGKKQGGYFMSISYVIAVGELAGERLSSLDDIDNRVCFERDGEPVTSLDLLSQRLQLLGVETSDLNLSELPEVAQALSDPSSELGKPYASATIRNKMSDNPNDPDKPYHNQNIYINQTVEPEEVEALRESAF